MEIQRQILILKNSTNVFSWLEGSELERSSCSGPRLQRGSKMDIFAPSPFDVMPRERDHGTDIPQLQASLEFERNMRAAG